MSERSEFLAGERLEDVAFFLHDEVVGNPDALLDHAERVDDGLFLVVDGDDGRSAFQSATGVDPMALARQAMATDGHVDRTLIDATCPESDGDGDPAEESEATHRTRFVFAFAEARNEEVGGIYAEGDVVHAYARCGCGTTYSDKWLIGEE